jgi:hypothetical protein
MAGRKEDTPNLQDEEHRMSCEMKLVQCRATEDSLKPLKAPALQSSNSCSASQAPAPKCHPHSGQGSLNPLTLSPEQVVLDQVGTYLRQMGLPALGCAPL